MSEAEALERLSSAGLRCRKGARWVPTARWHAAIARASLAAMSAGETLEDLRVPVVRALMALEGEGAPDEALVAQVLVMAPLTGGPVPPP